MRIEVTLSEVTLADVIEHVCDDYGEYTETTLGESVTDALLEHLKRDPGFASLADRFADMIGRHLRAKGPEYVQKLVAAEVERQLTSTRQGAITRGEPSTKAEAIVATEVTTQLRAAFAPVVERHLAELSRELDALTQEAITSARAAVEGFRKGPQT